MQSRPRKLTYLNVAVSAAIVALGLASLWAPAAHADAVPGDLDASFSGNGLLITDFNTSESPLPDAAFAVAASRGTLIAAGRSASGDGHFALARYRPNGELSPVFGPGGGGRVVTDFGQFDVAKAVALIPGLRVYAAGFSDSGGDGPIEASKFAVASYFTNGELNTGFGGDGKVVTDIDDGARAEAIALQPDGKVIVAGTLVQDELIGEDEDFALARYNTDGSLDPSFDGNGKVGTGFGGADFADAVAIQPDGKIVVGGTRIGDDDSDFALARYMPDGSLDPSFSGNGMVATDLGEAASVHDLAIQPDGRIVAAGHGRPDGGDNRFALVRYMPDGSLDPSFGGDGRVEFDLVVGESDIAEAVALQDDGKIVAAGGMSSGGGNFAVARFNQDGTPDNSFGDPAGAVGYVQTGIGAREVAEAVAIQPDGKVVAAGSTTVGDGSFFLARYHAVALDETPPETTIDSGPPGLTNDSAPTFEFHSSEPGSTFECRIVGGDFGAPAFEACSSPFTFGPIEDGSYVFQVRATDAAGNADLSLAFHRFTVDTNAPETTIDTGPSGTTNDPTPEFAFSSSEAGVSFQCAVDSDMFAACTSPQTLAELADGPHTFRARAVDGAGNADPTPAQRSFTVNTSPPAGGGNGGGGNGGGGNPPGEDAAVPCPAGTSPSVTCTINRKGHTVFAGTELDETFVGTRGRDMMHAGAGSDTLRGRDGRDTLKGGGGKDRLRGGGGRDRLSGGAGRDIFSGGGGNDRINAKGQRREKVGCGGGKRDRVKNARGDRVKRDCERVRR